MNKIHFEEISSTNSYAKELIGSDSFCHGTLITASRQSGGRGRHGNSFFSEGGLYMSVLLDARNPDYPLTMAAAVAVRETLISEYDIVTNIKWVNDLFYNNKKVCGILTESKIHKNEPKGFVCGIGVNTAKTVIPEYLSDIAGTVPVDSDIKKLSELIAEKLVFMYENNINPLRKYKEGLILNVPVDVFTNGEFLYSGTAVDINEAGNLIVDRNGEMKILNSGEISIKL